MAKKMNSFAADFEGISNAADDKVFAMLKQAKGNDSQSIKELERTTPKQAGVLEKTKSEEPPRKLPKGEKKKTTRPKPVAEWGKPVAHFNTRIPEKMAELLDDLVYKLRKKGEPKTKQDLAQEAIQDLLQKHSTC